MANILELKNQLRKAGFINKHWGWSAIRQLPSILDKDETIERVTSGFYDGGHAVVVATNKRIIFLDKKIMSFKAEEIHYEMVTEVAHFMGMFTSKLHIHCLTNEIELTSILRSNIQEFAIYVDQKVNQIRLNMKNVTAWSQMLDAANPNNTAIKPKSAIYPTTGQYSPRNLRG